MSSATKTPATHWPTAVDFQNALQVPAICFQDPDLQNAEIASGPFGLPFAITGNVAAVFRLKLPEGDVAMRCFTRSGTIDRLEYRYHVLDTHLKKDPIPALVRCAYRKDVMLVGGTRYPVVMMAWIKGLQLPGYIENHLSNAEAMRTLADRWRVLMVELQSANFAHGDLSDGNILVDEEGRFHLIDYDAAYVPKLKKDPPNEVGKPNYQHPERLSSQSPRYGYYDANVDAFASLVIYLTLRALAADPDLWHTYHTGDNLIFEQRDFEQPGRTAIWPHLRTSKDADVRRLVDVLENYCLASVADLPFLEKVVDGSAPRLKVRHDDRFVAPDETERMDGFGTLPPLQDLPPMPSQTALRNEPDTAVIQPVDREAVRQTRWVVWTAVVAAVLVVLMAAAYFLWQEGVFGEVPLAREVVEAQSFPPPAEAVTTLQAQDLGGYYTGYIRHENGSRDLLNLTIDPPAVFFAQNEARFAYALSSKEYQTTGGGTFNINSGHLSLGTEYKLYVASADGEQIVLASMERIEDSPVIWFKRRMSP